MRVGTVVQDLLPEVESIYKGAVLFAGGVSTRPSPSRCLREVPDGRKQPH